MAENRITVHLSASMPWLYAAAIAQLLKLEALSSWFVSKAVRLETVRG